MGWEQGGKRDSRVCTVEEFALGSLSALAAASGCPSFMSLLLLEGARHAASPWGCVPPCCSFLELVDEPAGVKRGRDGGVNSA